MSPSAPVIARPSVPPPSHPRRGIRAIGLIVVGALVAVIVIVVTLVWSAAPSAPRAVDTLLGATPGGLGAGVSGDAEHGALPDGVSVFDDGYAAVANLDGGLLSAIRDAASAASADGVAFVVNSGWRSPEYQRQLLQEAISEYGSEDEAARWVATAETSPHVSGNAIDIGPTDATSWLSIHGAEYGLCQIYANESWHYELRPDAVTVGCPEMYQDPTYDPRMG